MSSLGATVVTFIVLVMLLPRSAGSAPLQLLSVRDSSASQPAGGNGNSVAPQISPDGRFVLFTSSASDLVSGDNGLFTVDVFLRDRASNTTALISANLNGTGGGNGNSMFGMICTNGRYVVFQSDANDLVPGDTNGVSDIFMRDLVAGTTALVSAATNGGFANGASTDPVMTPDGRYVVFLSAATNLVANDTNGLVDIFVRDMVSNTTSLVSVGAVAPPSGISPTLTPPVAPVITPDGRYVAFFSANNFAVGVPYSGAPYHSMGEVYVRDLVAGTTIWASSNAVSTAYTSATKTTYMSSYHPTISDDGRYVAFKTGWASGSGITAIFQNDLVGGSLAVIATNGIPLANGVTGGTFDDLYGPEIAPAGGFVAFVATNKAIPNVSVNLWNAQTGTNIIVSLAQDGSLATNTFSCTPVVSPDGRFVAFLSTAANLVSNAVSSGFHVYLRDVQAGITQLIDADTNGAGSTDELGTVPSLSADGRFVAFCGLDGGLVAADNNNAYDVFLRDTIGATTELISQRSPLAVSQSGNALSSFGPFSISADGRWAAFASYASDLVTNDFNNDRDVFVSDVLTGSNILVSVGMDGNSALGGSSVTPAISANGRFVAFVSAATNLVANDTNSTTDVFVRDLQLGTTTLASVDSSGAALGSGDSSAPVISRDGRSVAFLAKTNVSTTYPSAFWRDMISGTTVRLANASSNAPSMSADGQRVAYFDSRLHLYVWDAQLAAVIYTNTSTVVFASLSPTGTRILWTTAPVYPNPAALIVTDLAGNSTLLAITTRYPVQMPKQSIAPWSGDARFLAFVATTNFTGVSGFGTNDVCLCDLQTGTLTLVSASSNGAARGNGISDSPMVSSDGRFVAYRSFASNIVPGISNAPSLFVFDRMTGSNTVLTTGTSGAGWSFWASQPIASTNGGAVFQSWDSGQVPSDLNRVQDVFASTINTVSLADSDSDGIPDWWMIKYFGHPTGQASDLSRAQDDADGNGMSNLQKYLTGIDPTNPNAIFALQIAPAVNSGGTVSLTFPAVAGKSYQILYGDDLSNPNWQIFSGSVAVIGGQGSITIPASQSSRFYRVVCVN